MKIVNKYIKFLRKNNLRNFSARKNVPWDSPFQKYNDWLVSSRECGCYRITALSVQAIEPNDFGKNRSRRRITPTTRKIRIGGELRVDKTSNNPTCVAHSWESRDRI